MFESPIADPVSIHVHVHANIALTMRLASWALALGIEYCTCHSVS